MISASGKDNAKFYLFVLAGRHKKKCHNINLQKKLLVSIHQEYILEDVCSQYHKVKFFYSLKQAKILSCIRVR